MYPSTHLHLLLYEADLTPGSIVLDNRQRLYACRLLSLPDEDPEKKILPISLRVGDRTFQPKQLQKNNLIWTKNARPTLYGQWLAWQMTLDHSFDPADGVEPVEVINPGINFQREIIIDCKKQALRKATKDNAVLVI